MQSGNGHYCLRLDRVRQGVRTSAAGKPEQTVSANVSVFDQMTDAEQRTMLAALEALRRD
jgi:hypothetical protein